mgnify:CR=1 FL=1
MTGVQTCALPISDRRRWASAEFLVGAGRAYDLDFGQPIHAVRAGRRGDAGQTPAGGSENEAAAKTSRAENQLGADRDNFHGWHSVFS